MHGEGTPGGPCGCTLCIESEPAGAQVTVGGDVAGRTPLCVSLPPGTHRIRVALEGRVPWESEITLAGSQTLYLPVLSLRTAVPPAAAIQTVAGDGQDPLAVGFRDVSTGDVSHRTWDFGDGATSTDAETVHAYRAPGNYTVTLVACGPAGCDTASVLVRVGNQAPPGSPANATAGGPLQPSGDNPPVIGGSTGFIEVRCPVEGAAVYVDGIYRGEVRGGTLRIPIYLTGSPCRTLTVRAEGYLPATVPIQKYPGEGETVTVEIRPVRIGPVPALSAGLANLTPRPGNVTVPPASPR
ncbi:MAG: PEGA domain-containing protein [Methanolinea sp.]|nr:PEGA domain-containing protein [Methanolinea sp.]